MVEQRILAPGLTSIIASQARHPTSGQAYKDHSVHPISNHDDMFQDRVLILLSCHSLFHTSRQWSLLFVRKGNTSQSPRAGVKWLFLSGILLLPIEENDLQKHGG